MGSRIPLSSHPLQHSFFCRLFGVGHSDQCKVYLILVLISISLVISDVEHLFIGLLVICMSSLEKYLFRFYGQL